SQGVRFVNDNYPVTSSSYGWRSNPTVIHTPRAYSSPGVLVSRMSDPEFSSSSGVPLVMLFDPPISAVQMRLGFLTGSPSCTATVSLFNCRGELRRRGTLAPAENFNAFISLWDPDAPTGRTTLVTVDYGSLRDPEAIDDLKMTVSENSCTDTDPPTVDITSHRDHSETSSERIILGGEIRDASGSIATFKINGTAVAFTPALTPEGHVYYTFQHTVTLSEGPNEFTAWARDRGGLTHGDSVIIHYGRPVGAQVTHFHLTQRGLMEDKPCDVDSPFVAGKFTIVRIKLDVVTDNMQPSYAQTVEMNLYRKTPEGEELVDTIMGTTYSPFVSTFSSSSGMAGIHFWIDGSTVDTPGLYTMRFQPYVGLTPIGDELLTPCGDRFYPFLLTRPLVLAVAQLAAPLFDPALGPDHTQAVLSQLHGVARQFPVKDGLSDWWFKTPRHGVVYAFLGALPVCDGSAEMHRMYPDACKGTGFEWTFKDTHASGLTRADTRHAFGPAARTCEDDGKIGGRIVSTSQINLPRQTVRGLYTPGGWPHFPRFGGFKYFTPFDDDHDGAIHNDQDDLAHYIAEYYDTQRLVWVTGSTGYEHGEPFRGWLDKNGNNCWERTEEKDFAPISRRFFNRDHRGPALRRLAAFKARTGGGIRLTTELHPKPFHPEKSDFGMHGPGSGGRCGDYTWIRPVVTDNVLVHELGHNFCFGHKGQLQPRVVPYLHPWAAYVFRR
ncbi:hypothetical protein ACFLSJ_09285, partial [Verrucomicrobiota bacterium]